MRGFSLIELLIVIAIILIDGGRVSPHGSMYGYVVCENIEAQSGLSLFFHQPAIQKFNGHTYWNV